MRSFFGHSPHLIHLDLALFFRGQGAHDRGLDERDERHIRVSRNSDSAQKMRGQYRCQEDGRRAVGAADDADGRRLVAVKAQHDCQDKGTVDAKLRSRAQKQALGVGEQRTKIGHRADAEENQTGVNAGLYADVQKIE